MHPHGGMSNYLMCYKRGMKSMSRVRNKIRYEYEIMKTNFNRLSTRWIRQPTVIGMSETIDAIKDRKASIARYGDGEFDIIFGRTEGFQNQNHELSKRLREILKCNSQSEKFLVGIPDCFGSLEQFTEDAQLHWRIRLDKERVKWVRCLNTKYPYYQAQITRFYFDWADKSQCAGWYEGLKRIWDGENVILVEGELSRVGVGNELFDNATSVRRILCPAENAFDHYDEILNEICQKANYSDLIFMALGPTATVLAYDLFKRGYWAMDAGHIDLEYEWMKQGASKKTAIKGKYVNEVKGGNVVDNTSDKEYISEIIARVGL